MTWNGVFAIGIGLLAAAILLGWLSGNYLTLWLVMTLAILAVACGVYVVRELRHVPRTGASTRPATAVVGLYVLACLAIFVIVMLVTYYQATDEKSIGEIFKSIHFLR